MQETFQEDHTNTANPAREEPGRSRSRQEHLASPKAIKQSGSRESSLSALSSNPQDLVNIIDNFTHEHVN